MRNRPSKVLNHSPGRVSRLAMPSLRGVHGVETHAYEEERDKTPQPAPQERISFRDALFCIGDGEVFGHGGQHG